MNVQPRANGESVIDLYGIVLLLAVKMARFSPSRWNVVLGGVAGQSRLRTVELRSRSTEA